MKLSAGILKNIDSAKVIVPNESLLGLPEKVLQFGTGMLLRGLPDYFIDKANRKGIFNGRIVVVKSTSKGDTASFNAQNNLYTLCIRGIENGKRKEENIINSSISRVLNAGEEWEEILKCAHNRNLQIVISNTTEVGLKLVKDDISNHPPLSYPGKLLAFLVERFQAFNGSADSGLIIIPTELIPDNGKKLKSIVLELAHLSGLHKEFIEWLNQCNFFCSSLVDRIVTGIPGEKIKHEIENELGYEDDLLTLCEVYCLWAIEGDGNVKRILSFAVADEGLIISPDIALYRELKLRLLNATHTMSCGVAFFSNINTVKEAMEDKLMSVYIADLMKKEIGPAIPYEINSDTLDAYSEKVLDRFRNPHINHIWKNITLNYSSKIKLRCVPVVMNFYKSNNRVPELFALGFAAYIYFMKAVKQNEKLFFGVNNGNPYLIEDEEAENFYHMWQTLPINEVANRTLKNIDLWGTDLSTLPGFQQSVIDKLNSIINNGMRFTLESIK